MPCEKAIPFQHHDRIIEGPTYWARRGWERKLVTIYIDRMAEVTDFCDWYDLAVELLNAETWQVVYHEDLRQVWVYSVS